MIEYEQEGSKFVEVRRGNPAFTNTTSHVRWNRAAIKVSNSCPANFVDIINYCMTMGFIEPVAYMKTTEYVAARLESE